MAMATMFPAEVPRSAASMTLRARSRIPASEKRIPRRWFGTGPNLAVRTIAAIRHARVPYRPEYVMIQAQLDEGENDMRRSSVTGSSRSSWCSGSHWWACPRAPSPAEQQRRRCQRQDHQGRGRRRRRQPFAPGVLKGIVDGVQGWGKYVNANGGIAGRKVQVDFIDSKLNPNDTRNAHHQGVLGGLRARRHRHAAAADARRHHELRRLGGQGHRHPRHGGAGDQRRRGLRADRVPDHAAVGAVRHDRQEPTQTYRANNGDSKYLLKKNKDLHGSFVLASDSPSVVQHVEGAQQGRPRRRASRPTARGTSPRTRRRASTRRSSRR